MRNFANRNRVLGFGLALAAILVTSMTAKATVTKIQFDLARGTTPITQSVGSPGLATGWFNNSDTTWNQVISSTTSYSSLQYTDGTAATGVVAQYGSVGAGGPTSPITWNSNTNLGNVGPTGDGGVSLYTGNNMVQYLSYFGSNGALGLRVTGLTPGQYEVLVTAVHPQALARAYNIGIGANLTQQVGSPTALTANNTNTWTAGANYALGVVTISSLTDSLDVISSGSSFPVINGIQIVTVPEPASLGLLSIGAVALLRRRGRAA